MQSKGDNVRHLEGAVHMQLNDWNHFYFYTVHSILFTILVCDSLNCGYYVQVGQVPETRT